MFDFRLPINLSNLDLTTIFAIAAGILVVVLTLGVLLTRSALRSRLALVIAFGLIVMGALSNLGAVTGLIAIAGVIVIGIIITLGRNKDVLDLIRALVKPNDTPLPVDRLPLSAPRTTVDQLPPTPARSVSTVRPRSHHRHSPIWGKWGF